jgi:hypothetical protein
VLKSPEAASRTTFSPDPQQRFLYVLDRRHQRILILDRKTLEILGSFGGGVGDQRYGDRFTRQLLHGGDQSEQPCPKIRVQGNGVGAGEMTQRVSLTGNSSSPAVVRPKPDQVNILAAILCCLSPQNETCFGNRLKAERLNA